MQQSLQKLKLFLRSTRVLCATMFLGAASLLLSHDHSAGAQRVSDLAQTAAPGVACPEPSSCPHPTVAPTAKSTPTPAPTPRAPTSTDYTQIQSATGYTKSKMAYIVIDGNYCYFGWHSSYIGGAYLLTNTSGSWRKLMSGKGDFAVVDLRSAAPAMTTAIAQALKVGEASQEASRK